NTHTRAFAGGYDSTMPIRHAERMEVLYEASHAFAHQVLDPARLVDVVARTCSEVIGDFGSVTLVCDGGEWLEQVAVHHPDPDIERGFAALARATRVRIGEGLTGKVIEEDRPMLLPEVDPESVAARAPAEFR